MSPCIIVLRPHNASLEVSCLLIYMYKQECIFSFQYRIWVYQVCTFHYLLWSTPLSYICCQPTQLSFRLVYLLGVSIASTLFQYIYQWFHFIFASSHIYSSIFLGFHSFMQLHEIALFYFYKIQQLVFGFNHLPDYLAIARYND